MTLRDAVTHVDERGSVCEMFDPRWGWHPDPLVFVLSEHRRGLMNIPAGVWHADRNLGDKDCVVVNFPTIVYDHEAPDKHRLPLGTDAIPYEFPPDVKGW